MNTISSFVLAVAKVVTEAVVEHNFNVVPSTCTTMEEELGSLSEASCWTTEYMQYAQVLTTLQLNERYGDIVCMSE